MADFTDFTWETGDYGEAAKFNAMVDNDRHLRERTDFQSFNWALTRSRTIFSPTPTYRVFFGGIELVSGSHNPVGVTGAFHVNLDISAVGIGLRVLQIYLFDTAGVLSARIHKNHGMNYLSVVMSIDTSGVISGVGRTAYAFDISVILHRLWQAW